MIQIPNMMEVILTHIIERHFDTSWPNVNIEKDNQEDIASFEDTKIPYTFEVTFSYDAAHHSGNSIEDVQIEKDNQQNAPMFEDVQLPQAFETTSTYGNSYYVIPIVLLRLLALKNIIKKVPSI